MKETELDSLQEMLRAVTRRHFFKQAGFGIGSAALTSLLNRRAFSAGLSPEATSSATAPVNAAVNPLAPKPPMFAAEGEERHLPLHGRRALPGRSVRLQAQASAVRRPGIPEEFIKGERFAFIKGTPKLLGSPYRIRALGQVRRAKFRSCCRTSAGRRRHRHRALHAHHAVQPRAGPDLHEHRLPDHRPAQHGLLDDLRAGQRVQRPAGFRGADLGRKPAGWRQSLLGQRFPSHGLSGRRVPFARRPGAVPHQPRRRRPAQSRRESLDAAQET